jgi:nucleoside-diphosphate-sugar epimerase
MKIFITGAPGFIGNALVPELIQAGHQVLGLSRSEAGANALTAAGAQARQGTIQDLDILRDSAAKSDAVIHLAFNHDFSKFAANSADDKLAIETLGAALKGTDRPLIVTSGVAMLAPGRTATEADPPVPVSPHFPRASEATAIALAEQGINASTMRLSQIHDTHKAGLCSYFAAIARQKGVSAYVGDGQNRWAAAHLLDTAHLYRLAIEQGKAGDRYHAVTEEGVTAREIAEAIGRGLNLPAVSKTPEEAAEHFGFLAFFVSADGPASSAQTQQRLGWNPKGNPTLIEDLNNTNFNEG